METRPYRGDKTKAAVLAQSVPTRSQRANSVLVSVGCLFYGFFVTHSPLCSSTTRAYAKNQHGCVARSRAVVRVRAMSKRASRICTDTCPQDVLSADCFRPVSVDKKLRPDSIVSFLKAGVMKQRWRE